MKDVFALGVIMAFIGVFGWPLLFLGAAGGTGAFTVFAMLLIGLWGVGCLMIALGIFRLIYRLIERVSK